MEHLEGREKRLGSEKLVMSPRTSIIPPPPPSPPPTSPSPPPPPSPPPSPLANSSGHSNFTRNNLVLATLEGVSGLSCLEVGGGRIGQHYLLIDT
ncbi:hypothetical protein Pcinc_041264 [Petrolisthes cinctipes]|uniref:Uncharacterized protein n=1 Tax=Petrolisthes cinctipes TaxID=88211 RepID=A0AAE1BJW4_PETCI|nr:hypothetical protein Pcinc_041264 [Petrolisthes cinctipes]